MPIPADLRNNLTHQMYCYGIDVTGGDSPTLLTGSPKPFRFSTETIGSLDVVGSFSENGNEAVAVNDGEVAGWSLDTDLPGNSNPVHFYIDGPAGSGIYIDQTLANIPRPDVNTVTGYPGDHGFSYFIPDQYRDGLTHTIYAYGIDITGGPPKLLQGSPKTFNLNTRVSTLTFEPLSTATIRSVIDVNPTSMGGGQRIFPDKDDPSTTIDPYRHDIVQVKVLITPVKQGVKVYFKSYDLDDPSAAMLPLDDDTGANTGNDNRGSPKSGTFKTTSALTDASGIATLNFVTTMQPGDNFAVAASTNTTYLGTITIDGTNLKDNANTQIPATLACSSSAVNACRTDMLTVWRRLHIEVDSMGQAKENYVDGTIDGPINIGSGIQTISLNPSQLLRINRFENGLLVLNDSSGKRERAFNVIDYDITTTPPTDANSRRTVTINNTGTTYLTNGDKDFVLYDDDDFNDNDNMPFSLKGDKDQDILEPDRSMLSSVDTACPDTLPVIGNCNIFAKAYIRPVEDLAGNQGNVQFIANMDFATREDVISRYFYNKFFEDKKDFWTIYLLGAYQEDTGSDSDPVESTNAVYGVATFFYASTIFLELNRPAEFNRLDIGNALPTWRNRPIGNKFTTVHEVGHIFGCDHFDGGPATADYGIMGTATTRITPKFNDYSLAIIRSVPNP
jgi:hypothetical protein